jgi:hypothetical protein
MFLRSEVRANNHNRNCNGLAPVISSSMGSRVNHRIRVHVIETSRDYYLGDPNGPTDRHKILPVRTQILGKGVYSSVSNTICVHPSICSPERRFFTGIYENREGIIIGRIVR